jgi:hypothetical protein
VVSTIRCELGSIDLAIACPAAKWAQAFHPSLTVQLDSAEAVLSSAGHSEDQLRAIWLSSLANERLHASAASRRTAALATLVQ